MQPKGVDSARLQQLLRPFMDKLVAARIELGLSTEVMSLTADREELEQRTNSPTHALGARSASAAMKRNPRIFDKTRVRVRVRVRARTLLEISSQPKNLSNRSCSGRERVSARTHTTASDTQALAVSCRGFFVGQSREVSRRPSDFSRLSEVRAAVPLDGPRGLFSQTGGAADSDWAGSQVLLPCTEVSTAILIVAQKQVSPDD